MAVRFIRIRAFFSLGLAVLILLLSFNTKPVAGQVPTGTIAYTPADTMDEIRLIEPDGSNDRRLWAHGQSDLQNVDEIWNIAWKPDATELAFASTHENWCSQNHADVFVLGVNTHSYRRITEAPACAALAGYPKGVVQVPVHGGLNSFVGFVYFQGAPSVQQVSLPAGGSGLVTFHDVADFGPGVIQSAVLIQSPNRRVDIGTAVDVQPGETVRTASMRLFSPSTDFLEAHSATWSSDGLKLGFVFNTNSLKQISSTPSPLQPADPLVAAGGSQLPDFVEHITWGPTSAQANQLLYAGYEYTKFTGIFRITKGSTTGGEALVSLDASGSVQRIRGLAWLPDGSGFIFALEETEFYQSVRANLFEYNFASGQAKRLTNFSSEFTGYLSVAPDGQQIVFERSPSKEANAPTDLWVINRDGSGLRLLAHNAARPAWSQQALPGPLVQRSYIPLVQR